MGERLEAAFQAYITVFEGLNLLEITEMSVNGMGSTKNTDLFLIFDQKLLDTE